MKAQEYLAKQYAINWTKPRLGEAEIAALEAAYLEGFNKMKDLASGLMTDLRVPKLESLSILINGIGTVDVDPNTGKRLSEDEE